MFLKDFIHWYKILIFAVSVIYILRSSIHHTSCFKYVHITLNLNTYRESYSFCMCMAMPKTTSTVIHYCLLSLCVSATEYSGIAKDGLGRVQTLPNICCVLPLKLKRSRYFNRTVIFF